MMGCGAKRGGNGGVDMYLRFAPRKTEEIGKLWASLRNAEAVVQRLEESYGMKVGTGLTVVKGLTPELQSVEQEISKNIMYGNALLSQRAMSFGVIFELLVQQKARLKLMHRLFLLSSILRHLESMQAQIDDEPVPLVVVKFNSTPFPGVFKQVNELYKAKISCTFQWTALEEVHIKSEPRLMIITESATQTGTNLMKYKVEAGDKGAFNVEYRLNITEILDSFPREELVFLRICVDVEQGGKSLTIESVLTKPFVLMKEKQISKEAICKLFEHIVFEQEEIGGLYHIPSERRQPTIQPCRLINCLEYLLTCLGINQQVGPFQRRGISHLERITIAQICIDCGIHGDQMSRQEVSQVFNRIADQFVIPLFNDITLAKLWACGIVVGFIQKGQAEKLLKSFEYKNRCLLTIDGSVMFFYYDELNKLVRVKYDFSLSQLPSTNFLNCVAIRGSGAEETFEAVTKEGVCSVLPSGNPPPIVPRQIDSVKQHQATYNVSQPVDTT